MKRLVMSAIHRAMRVVWFVTRPRTRGVHALCLTPDERVILVEHSYATGWYMPGGGRRRNETARDAMLRELKEEIGLIDYAAMVESGEFDHRPNYRHDRLTFFVVSGVIYRPPGSWEIAGVRAFPLDDLPAGVAGSVGRRIGEWRTGSRGCGEW